MMQEQYWKELYQLKVHIHLIELLLERAERVDRVVKIILAVSSSVSIGAWAIWNHYSYVWAAIIATSQVLTAVRPFLPYSNRIKAYSPLIRELEELMIHSEYKWSAISNGELTTKQINKARFDLRCIKHKAIHKHIKTTIPTDLKLQKKAEEIAVNYLMNFYYQGALT